MPRWLLPVLGLLVLLSLGAEQLYQPFTTAMAGGALEEALGLPQGQGPQVLQSETAAAPNR